ncbi:hypothetical protein [Streptomyces sp. NPDC014685]|uniref:hypothetical protein n=1 Tax=Streptomyces sp. NPDC014685 TaxID=3364881 RepID=UPI0036F5CDB9
MVVYPPDPLWCCPLGFVMKAAYERARARCDTAEANERGPNTRATYDTMLVALVTWCEHQIDMHGSDPGPVKQCPVCASFEEPAPVQRKIGGRPVTAQEWAYERRVHQVAHRLGPRTVTLAGETGSEPSEPAAGDALSAQ